MRLESKSGRTHGHVFGVITSAALLAACGDDGGVGTESTTAALTTGPAATDTTRGGATEVDPTGPTPTTTEGGGSATLGATTCASDCAGTTTEAATTTEGALTTAGESTTGAPCEGAECCAEGEQLCGESCCAAGEVCSFQQCVQPGADCKEKTDCAGDEYCEYSLGEPDVIPNPECQGGVVEPKGKCLPKPPLCGPNDPPQDPNDPTCLLSCTYDPAGGFDPTLKFAWGGQTVAPYSTDIMMTPIVIQLDDDDCDGKISERDIPEIVFSTFSNGQYTAAGVLRAISIVEGQVVEKWSVPGAINATKQLAGGDLDGQPGNEVVACAADGTARAFKGDGSPLWTSPALTCFMPSIADLDGDGTAEVIVEGAILDGATGAIEASFAPPLNSSFIVSDLDGDGALDIVTSSRGYHADGAMFVDTELAELGQFYGTQDWKSPWPAVADFDGDGAPEVVVVDNLNHALSVWRPDPNQAAGFAVVRAPVDINGGLNPALCGGGSWGNTHGGGPPTIADFDGDGVPDVGTAGGIGYAVFSGTKLLDPVIPAQDTLLWIKQTTDCSSASTGSSVFDFDGDGKAEVVYSDQNRLRVYEGPTGDVLFETCNTTATLIEYPVIADVDNDGQADIVVVSNAYGKANAQTQCNDGKDIGQSGVRVFGAGGGKWVRTRRVWNEHAYHVTNVEESGAIPAQELANWQVPGLNNFRQNKQPDSEFAAPDAIAAIEPLCEDESYALVATVRNVGEAALPAGVVVGFYTGAYPGGTKVGELVTSKALYPLEAEVLKLPFDMAPQDVKDGLVEVYVVADDTQEPHPSWTECRVDNNVGAASGKCVTAG